jgi:dienelactone hydrolase
MTTTLVLLTVALGPAADPPKPEERARALVTAASKEDFDAASKDFDDTMKKVMPPDKFGQTWKGLVEKVGPLKKQGRAIAEKVQKYDVIWLECEFEKATVFVRLVFDSDGKVAGLSFRDSGPAKEYKAPAYVKRDTFKESEVKVGEGEWVLPATLSLPAGDGPFPALVLVHGSGPHDRDETIGGGRTFRDLAWGLASQGMAVLRYEKRTKQHGIKFAAQKDATVKEEVLDDALAAVALLRKTKGIDGRRVFLLGHSLGAMAAPRLGELDPEIAGLILMASPSRPMADVLIEQLDYVQSVNPSPQQKSAVEKLKAQAEKLRDPKLPLDTPAKELPFGVSARYWRSMDDLAPVRTALRVKQPLLILQGGRDYQSTMEDFEGWKKALAERKGATLKSYPRLNHVFAAGNGKATPAEYEKEAHVAKEVVDDIAAWVKGK